MDYHDPVLFFKLIVDCVKTLCKLNVKTLKKELHSLNLKCFKYVVPDDNTFVNVKY